jgi:predicted outer membrane lipoprotein
MISGVVLVLVGEALLLRSLPLAVWAAAFAALNAVYLPFVEERCSARASANPMRPTARTCRA